MKIALFTGGSFYGDVGPYLQIAKGLESRGHEILLVIPEEYADRTTEFNCCHYMGEVLSKELEQNSPSYDAMIAGILKNLLQNSFDRIESVLHACKDVDVILSHPLCAISDVVADFHNIRNVEILASCMYFNGADEDTRTTFLNSIGLDPLNACRSKLNLAPVSHISMDIFRNTNTKITLFPQFFVKTDKPNVIFGNFIHYEDDQELSPELVEFITSGPPPIVFAMGSGSQHMTDPPNFNQITVEAAKKYRSVILGKAICNHENVFVCSGPVPYGKLFPFASLVVNHAGVGTVGRCLASNIPQIAVPQMLENKFNANLLSDLIQIIDPNDYTVDRLTAAIENPQYNFELGEKYSSIVNSIDVVDIIEKAINN